MKQRPAVSACAHVYRQYGWQEDKVQGEYCDQDNERGIHLCAFWVKLIYSF